jgi:thioredoxin reductase/polyferredoxin
VPGLYVVGDLTGIPLLKFSADTGARVIDTIADDKSFQGRKANDPSVRDVAIIGGGVSGFAALKQAGKRGLTADLFEAAEPFSTIVNFPKGKPIYTYPTEMTPAGDLQFHDKADAKEGLIEDLHDQTLDAGLKWTQARIDRVKRSGGIFELTTGDGETIRAHRVVVAIGRSGNFRKLDVPGEDKDKVYNRLHDPQDFCGTKALVVGGGDSAMETAIALAKCGADVTLSYRKPEFSRPKPENVEMIRKLSNNDEGDDGQIAVEEPTGDRVSTAVGEFVPASQIKGKLTLKLPSTIKQIRDDAVVLKVGDQEETIENEVVFSMIGREAPLGFFRKAGVKVAGDRGAGWWLTLLLMLATFAFFYQWKKPGTWLPLYEFFAERNWFPHNLGPWLTSLSDVFSKPANPLGTLKLSAAGAPGMTGSSPGFWFSLLYSTLIVMFGFRRIRRRRTPYVKVQTWALMLFQCVPLFLLPYLLFPWLGHNGWFDSGVGKMVADALFPPVDYDPHGREYWRAFGLILAWPLFIWNVFTDQPLWTWLAISVAQTFVIIPALIYFFGKGAYCGWVCSCGAMAETLGDTHRHKMPHGPLWNRVNMIGQAFLTLALGILLLRVLGWSGVDWADKSYKALLKGEAWGLPALNYAWFVDLFWAGILGFGLYFHFSGRVWCRFACPLAALMHIYARFSRFAILSDKKKCISCNVCTSVCHQGIDIMNFANKGLPMVDPECVRCSACVQSCPTGVLTFGQIDRKTHEPISIDPDWLAASPVNIREGQITINGKPFKHKK